MVGRIVAGVLGVVVAATAVVGAMRFRAQRRVARLEAITTPDGIVESRYVTLGGVQQWVQVRGEHRDNPVLLVLHGGPGMSYIPLTALFRAWERDFTVVLWDRRGVGRTLRAGTSAEVTFDRLAEDGVELSEWLTRRLGKQTVGLVGHSVGSVVGVLMVRRRPDLFHAYVGTDQIADMRANEAESYRLLRERAALLPAGDRRRREVEALAPPPYVRAADWFDKQRLISATDPVARSYENRLFRTVLAAPDYSLADLRAFGQGLQGAAAGLLGEMMTLDLPARGTDFRVPMFLVEGANDVLDPTSLALAFFERIDAPRKEVVVLEGAGHNAMFMEGAAFLEVLRRRVLPIGRAAG